MYLISESLLIQLAAKPLGLWICMSVCTDFATEQRTGRLLGVACSWCVEFSFNRFLWFPILIFLFLLRFVSDLSHFNELNSPLCCERWDITIYVFHTTHTVQCVFIMTISPLISMVQSIHSWRWFSLRMSVYYLLSALLQRAEWDMQPSQ